MTTFDLDEAFQVLRATPGTMRALLGELSRSWTDSKPAPESWSTADILGHLINGEETDWIPRTKIMLAHGTSKPFEPFDRQAQFSAPQRTMDEMLDVFASLRARNLAELESLALDERLLGSRGTHPTFGEVRLGDMLAAWAVHDLSHAAQAAEALAKRYADAVGPWRRFLPVLDREELPSE